MGGGGASRDTPRLWGGGGGRTAADRLDGVGVAPHPSPRPLHPPPPVYTGPPTPPCRPGVRPAWEGARHRHSPLTGGVGGRAVRQGGTRIAGSTSRHGGEGGGGRECGADEPSTMAARGGGASRGCTRDQSSRGERKKPSRTAGRHTTGRAGRAETDSIPPRLDSTSPRTAPARPTDPSARRQGRTPRDSPPPPPTPQPL